MGSLSKKEEVIQNRIKTRKELIKKGATLGFKRPEGFKEGREIPSSDK